MVGGGDGRDGGTTCDNGVPGFGRDAMGARDMEPFTAPEAPGQPEPDPAPGCARAPGETAAEPWLRTELFFGCARPDGSAVAAAEWDAFLDAEITPRFPEGLTVLSGAGQWQEADGDVVEEWSKVVVLLYPLAKREESHAEIEAIRAAYQHRFGQEAVLRADDERPVRALF